MSLSFFRKFFRMDWVFFLLVVGLAVSSIAFIYSATYTSDDAELRAASKAQMYWIPLALIGYFVFALVDYRHWLKVAIPFFGVMLFLLVFVLLFGSVVNGAKSWFRFGPIGIQPAEISKLAFILLFAKFLASQDETDIKSLWTIIAAAGLTLAPAVLILAQPDLGSAGVFFPVALFMMFVAGVRLFYILVPIGAIAALVATAYFGIHQGDWHGRDYTLKSKSEIKIPFLKEYQINRIKTFFNPNLDSKGAGWTINQSLIAIGSGGWGGKGFKQGTQNVLGYLPKNIAYNDFIFSVIGEEWGFVGGSSVILLEGLILLFCLRVAFFARDREGALIATGVTAMLFTHIFINIGMTIQVVPITGIPLPFISYGGTFLVVCLAGVGLVQSVWIHRRILENKKA